MDRDRRAFIVRAGAALATAGFVAGCAEQEDDEDDDEEEFDRVPAQPAAEPSQQ